MSNLTPGTSNPQGDEPRSRMRSLPTHDLLVACGPLLVSLLTGCAATKVDVIWSNPEFAASKIEGKIMVVG